MCVSAKASMQTFPCGHRVVCRKCFVKTIQVAVSQRVLPLRCVICRTKIVRLKHSSHGRATPVTPGVRALLSPCEALGASRGPFLRPQDLDAPLNPLPESHYRHSAQACRFHRHSDGESTSEASCSTRTPQRTRTPEPCPESPPVAESLAHDTREEEERHEEPPLQSVQCSGLTRAVVHPPPRSPPEALPKSPPRVAPPAPKSSSPPVSLPNSRAVSPRPKPPPSPSSSSPSSSNSPRATASGASPRSSAGPLLSPDRPLIVVARPAPSRAVSPARPVSRSVSRVVSSSPVSSPPPSTASPRALPAAALATIVLPPPPGEVRGRRGQHRVSPGAALPLTLRAPLVKPRPASRFERFRDLHVRRPTLLVPIPEKEEPELLLQEAGFCRVAPGSSDLLVCASSPKISVLQDRAPLLQPDSPDRRRSLRSHIRSKMAGFPSLLGSPLRAFRSGTRHRRVPDVN